MSAIKINLECLMADLEKLRTFGACGNGVIRPAFSDTDVTARRWLQQRMADAGLEVVSDHSETDKTNPVASITTPARQPTRPARETATT